MPAGLYRPKVLTTTAHALSATILLKVLLGNQIDDPPAACASLPCVYIAFAGPPGCLHRIFAVTAAVKLLHFEGELRRTCQCLWELHRDWRLLAASEMGWELL